MLRRGVGRAGLQRQLETQEHYRQVGQVLSQSELKHAQEQLGLFHEKLEAFARQYKTEIQSDPVFRRHFQHMCAQIGVDPLASSKGFWSEILGVGDFYYELAIQIITCCIQAREHHGNGGLLSIEILKDRLKRLRKATVEEEDITRAVKSLKVLGNGYQVIQVGQRLYIQSVPLELSTDHISILDLARRNNGHITAPLVSDHLSQTLEHSQHILVSIFISTICLYILFRITCLGKAYYG